MGSKGNSTSCHLSSLDFPSPAAVVSAVHDWDAWREAGPYKGPLPPRPGSLRGARRGVWQHWKGAVTKYTVQCMCKQREMVISQILVPIAFVHGITVCACLYTSVWV